MRNSVIAVVQVAISVLVVGLVMPVVLATVPATRDNRVGLGVSVLFIAMTFVIVRLAWPRRRS
jgi:hypothetical protein